MNFWKTSIEKVIVHKVGNKALDEGIVLSNGATNIESDGLKESLISYFLKPLKGDLPSFSFTHPAELGMNEVYSVVTRIFDTPTSIVKHSKDLARILYDVSSHPKIKTGQLYIVLFRDCEHDGKMVNAVGIFKSENEDSFLKVMHENELAQMDIHAGFNLNKVDKGCLVLNTSAEEGFIVFNFDNTNKGEDAIYWSHDFLMIKPKSDSYNSTSGILNLTKKYITTSLPSEFDVSKTEQVEYLNRSLKYFTSNEEFHIESFQKQVFGTDDKKIESFQQFGSAFLSHNELDIAERFEISPQALKKQTRIFKSVLKLDKNFHIYIHGDTELIEKGFDSKAGKHYYKIYFDQES